MREIGAGFKCAESSDIINIGKQQHRIRQHHGVDNSQQSRSVPAEHGLTPGRHCFFSCFFSAKVFGGCRTKFFLTVVAEGGGGGASNIWRALLLLLWKACASHTPRRCRCVSSIMNNIVYMVPLLFNVAEERSTWRVLYSSTVRILRFLAAYMCVLFLH